MSKAKKGPERGKQPGEQYGFVLTELLVTACIFTIIAAAIFQAMTDTQQTGSHQSEVQAVMNNARTAMQTIQRYLRHAGNDPLGIGINAVTIVSAEEIRVQADITGSKGPSNPDKGDPDGDVGDSGENVTIRLNRRTRSLEIVPAGGSAQVVAGGISGLTFEYYDAEGNNTSNSSEVRKIGIVVSAASLQPDPRTRKTFGVQIRGEIQLPT